MINRHQRRLAISLEGARWLGALVWSVSSSAAVMPGLTLRLVACAVMASVCDWRWRLVTTLAIGAQGPRRASEYQG